jgi:hypothetical protein
MYRESIEAPEKFWAREAGAPPGGERAVSGLHPQQDSGWINAREATTFVGRGHMSRGVRGRPAS